MTSTLYKPGQIVKYSFPEIGEEDFRFLILENRGDRLFVQLICNEYLKPVFCYSISEFILV